MTIPIVPSPQENAQDSSNKYVWIAVALFALLVLCASIMFCVAELAIIRGSRTGASQPETGVVTEPQKDILKEISIDPQWKLEVNDEFNDNKHNWEVGPYVSDLVTLDRSIKNGKYVMDFQSSAYWTYWSFPDTNIAEDFVASVEIKHIEGNSSEAFGFIFRSTLRDYYLFQVDENGRVSFFIYTLDKYTTLMDRGTSVVKIGEANEVIVHAEGSHFIFYVNGIQVGEIDDDRLPNGFVGVVTSTSGIPGPVPNVDFKETQQQCVSKFEVDNFKLWVPVSGYKKLETLIPDKGRIVFVSDKDGNPEIYAINSDGTDPDRLTNDIADDHSPRWSSDGSKITFVSTRDGNPEIYIMNADGTGITRVTDNSSDDLDPAWSPDGKEIVFSSNRDGNYEIYIHNLGTNETERITEDLLSEDRYPEWSAKEDRILYRSTQYGNVAFYILQIDTKESTRVSTRMPPSSISRPVFSGDALRIAYEHGAFKDKKSITLFDLEKGLSTELVNGNEINLSPAWSPTDKQIAFVSSRDGQADIYIVNDDATAIFRVTNTAANERDLDWTEN